MFGSFILDVAVGMVFIYLLLSLVASGVNEILASIVQSRAANLQRGLRSLFSGDSIEAGAKLVDNLYDHGLIRGLYPDPEKDLGDTSGPNLLSRFRLLLRKLVGVAGKPIGKISNPLLLPSYIPARTFALALIDILNKNSAASNTQGNSQIESIEAFLNATATANPTNKAVEALRALVADAKNDAQTAELKLQKLQKNLEDWYNDAMDRVSGWYKRYTQKVLLIVGLVLAIVFNVNSISVAHLLWVDRDVRAGLANAASDYWKNHQPPTMPANAQAVQQPADQQAGAQPSAAPGLTAQDTAANPAAAGSAGQDSEAKLAGQLRSSVQAFTDVSNEYLLPVGWHHSVSEYATRYKAWWEVDKGAMALHVLSILVGWLITAGALSLGASFWFDMLNKIMVVRNTVKPEEKSQPEASKD